MRKRPVEEVCGKSIPQLEQGSKRACGVKVGSPKEGQAYRRSGAARILGIGKSGGLMPPHPTQGSLEKGRGLVLGEAKSETAVAVAVTRVVEAAGRRTHPPRSAEPQTTAKGVSAGRNRTLLFAAIVTSLVL
jgi:hypothetical protein